MAEAIKVGIIGTGVGLRTYLPAFIRSGKAEIIAISGSSEERAKEFADKNGIPIACKDYKELCDLEAIDLVCITSPNQFHYENVKYAMKKNKHMICEKPVAMNDAEMEELYELSKHYDKLCIVNHQLRFNPYFVYMKELLSQKALGDIYYVRIHQQSTELADRGAKWCWSFDAEQGGGTRLAVGSHLIDLVMYWFGADISTVKGAMDPVIKERMQGDTVRTVHASSFFSADLTLCDPVDVHLSGTQAAYGGTRFDVSIYGSEGELQFDLENKISLATSPGIGKCKNIRLEELVIKEELENKAPIYRGSFIYYARHIADAVIKNDRRILHGAAVFKDAFINQKILDAVKSSHDQGGLVTLQDRKRRINRDLV